MGILKGSLTVRRYDVIGELPRDYLVFIQEAMGQFAINNDLILRSKEENVGWALIQNLLENDFSEIDRWFVEPFVMGMMRVDQKSIPANLFRAHFRLKCEEWCKENDRQNCPARIKEEIRDNLRFEMVSKSLPKVSTVEFCWNLQEKWILFHSLTNAMNDRFVKLFYQTFNMQLNPTYPIDWVGDDGRIRSHLESSGASDLSFNQGEG